MGKIQKLIFLSVLAIALISCSGGDPENINVRIEAPSMVESGEEFIIRFIAENTDDKAQSIASLDIDNTYFEGIYIDDIHPESDEIYDIPLVDMKSFSFENVIIPPGESGEVIFYATALVEGDFSGDVDFCINNDYSFLTKSIRTVVGEGSGNSSGSDGGKKK